MQHGPPPGAGSTWSAVVRRHSIVVVWMVGLVLYGLDFLVKQIPLWRDPIDVSLAVDDVVPFAPYWAYVYIHVWLVLLFGMAGWYVRQNRHRWGRVRTLLLAAVVMQVSGWIAHFVVPTYFPRPEIDPELIEAGHLIWVIYSTDPPTHVLPSLHMASIFVAAWFFCRPRDWWRLSVSVAAVALISLSVMYTKQHGFIDVVAGVAWGWGACLVGVHLNRLLERRHVQVRQAAARRGAEMASPRAAVVVAGGDGSPPAGDGVPVPERARVSSAVRAHSELAEGGQE